MKKVLMVLGLIMAAFTLYAQVTVYRLESSGTNAAYKVPDHIRVTFETSNPTITTVTWAPVNEMWRASYRENNRYTQVYYVNTGEAFRVALPVISTHVPEEVVTSALDLYGMNLYDITKMKAADNTDVYMVRLFESGTPRTVWMNATGLEVTNVYKVKVDDDEIKIKTDDEMKMKVDDKQKMKTDGKEMKIKNDL